MMRTAFKAMLILMAPIGAALAGHAALAADAARQPPRIQAPARAPAEPQRPAIQAAPAAAAQLALPAGPNGIQNLQISPARLQAHVIRPAHIEGIRSDDGPDEGKLQFTFPARPQRGPGGIAAPPMPGLDVDAFGKDVHAALKDRVAGYAMQMRKNGNVIYTLQWQWSRGPNEGSQGWTPERRMHVASVSKLLTAMAMTTLLDDKNISPDAKIIDYLPAYWQKGPNINQISFRHLMTHRSGFSTGGSSSDYAFMKQRVAQGVPGVGGKDYENMNFGLMRILIAVIDGNISKNYINPAPGMNDIAWDFITIEAYKQYMQQNVFGPAGVNGASLEHPANGTLAYDFPVTKAGWNSGDLSSVSGGAAWHLSIKELMDVMSTFRRGGNKIMSAGKAQAMLDDSFGIDLTLQTPAGNLYNKNGRWQDGQGRVEQSLAYFLPEGMELVVLANSKIGQNDQFFRDVITNIYVANVK